MSNMLNPEQRGMLKKLMATIPRNTKVPAAVEINEAMDTTEKLLRQIADKHRAAYPEVAQQLEEISDTLFCQAGIMQLMFQDKL